MLKNARTLLPVLALSALACSSVKASNTVLEDWTFGTTGFTTVAAASHIYGVADTGVLAAGSSAWGVHAAAASSWSSPTGDGSPKSFSADHWAAGDYYEFSMSSVGYQNLSVSFNMTGSNTGPKTYELQYSTDGSTFNLVGSTFNIANVTWSAGSTAGNNESFSLSSITGLNNQSAIYFRIVDESITATGSIAGGAIGTAGTGRIDDFMLTGTASAVPEPATYALALGAIALGYVAIRRRQATVAA